MKNPCSGRPNSEMKNPLSKKTEGKFGQVFGKKGTAKKYIVGGK